MKFWQQFNGWIPHKAENTAVLQIPTSSAVGSKRSSRVAKPYGPRESLKGRKSLNHCQVTVPSLTDLNHNVSNKQTFAVISLRDLGTVYYIK